MSIDIKFHKNDLPKDLKVGNIIAVDGEFMGLNVRRDPLCLIQISTGASDAHIVQFDRTNYEAPNLVKILSDESITKIFHYGRADIAHIKYYLKTAQLKYCANDVIYLHKIHNELNKILERENRIGLYKDCLKFLRTRVDLDLALFKDDIWSH